MSNIALPKHIVQLNQCSDLTRTPLFIFHEITGDTYFYRPLAKRLQDEFPVYGVQLFNTGFDHESISLRELCSMYVKEIKQVWPVGAYRLAGWSSGGLLTIEAAYQLLSTGNHVDFVGLLDSSCYADKVEADLGAAYLSNQDVDLNSIDMDEFGREFREDLEFRLRLALDYFGVEVDLLPLMTFSKGFHQAPLFSQQAINKMIAAPELEPVFAEIHSALGWSKRKIIDKLNTVLTTKLMDERYYCPPLPIDVHLFYTHPEGDFNLGDDKEKLDSLKGESTEYDLQQPISDWLALFGDRLKYTLVSGDHFSMLAAPQVDDLAREILENLPEKQDTLLEVSKFNPVLYITPSKVDNTKPKLIYTLGYGEEKSVVDEMLKHLDKHFNLLLVSPRGLDGSTVPYFSVADAVQDYMQFIDITADDDCYVLGSDFGCWTAHALACSIREEHKCMTHLMLIDPCFLLADRVDSRSLTRSDKILKLLGFIEKSTHLSFGVKREALLSINEEQQISLIVESINKYKNKEEEKITHTKVRSLINGFISYLDNGYLPEKPFLLDTLIVNRSPLQVGRDQSANAAIIRSKYCLSVDFLEVSQQGKSIFHGLSGISMAKKYLKI